MHCEGEVSNGGGEAWAGYSDVDETQHMALMPDCS